MRYDVRLQTTTEALLVTDGRVSGVRVRDANGTISDLHGAGVILATPAHAAAALTAPILPQLSAYLRSVSYYPVSLVIAEYDRPIFTSTVRALVFDGDEALSNAGAYGINDLNIVRYTFSGRSFRRRVADVADAYALVARGEAALGKHVPVDAAWRPRFVARHFNPGLCAYTPHHAEVIDRIDRERQHVDGLHLTGDYMQGASIEACFRSAFACARQLAQQESRQPRPVPSAANGPSTLNPDSVRALASVL
jgi:oxygen-dependent protoporphyrinogen oxidase